MILRKPLQPSFKLFGNKNTIRFSMFPTIIQQIVRQSTIISFYFSCGLGYVFVQNTEVIVDITWARTKHKTTCTCVFLYLACI